jgi:hypothetical protein
MRDDIFRVPELQFEAVRKPDGSTTWSDNYRGAKVRTALPLHGGSRCIILLDPDTSEKAAFKNLFCAEQNGRLAWTAELPQTHDAFVDIEMRSDGLHAQSWSGFDVTLNPETGQIIRQEFVK